MDGTVGSSTCTRGHGARAEYECPAIPESCARHNYIYNCTVRAWEKETETEQRTRGGYTHVHTRCLDKAIELRVNWVTYGEPTAVGRAVIKVASSTQPSSVVRVYARDVRECTRVGMGSHVASLGGLARNEIIGHNSTL